MAHDMFKFLRWSSRVRFKMFLCTRKSIHHHDFTATYIFFLIVWKYDSLGHSLTLAQLSQLDHPQQLPFGLGEFIPRKPQGWAISTAMPRGVDVNVEVARLPCVYLGFAGCDVLWFLDKRLVDEKKHRFQIKQPAVLWLFTPPEAMV